VRPDDGALLSLEHVSKDYPPPPPMRVRRFFARFRGLHVEEGFAVDALAGQELDDEEDMADDDPTDLEPLPGQELLCARRVIDDVTLRARAGSVVGLTGPEGAGKTTLLKLVAGIVPPSEGRVMVSGSVAPALTFMALALPAKGHTVKSALPQLGAMVGIPPHLVRSRLDLIADLVDAPGLLKSSTSLMDSPRKREVLLSMALAVEPDILLVDMPIRHDAFGDRCLERIDALLERGGVVISERRDLRLTRLRADRVVALERGRLVDVTGEPASAPRGGEA